MFHSICKPSDPGRIFPEKIACFASFFLRTGPERKANEQLTYFFTFRLGYSATAYLNSEAIQKTKQCCNFVVHQFVKRWVLRFIAGIIVGKPEK